MSAPTAAIPAANVPVGGQGRGAATDTSAIKSTVQAAFERHPNRTGQLINVLNDVQERYRHLPPEAIELIAKRMDVPVEQIERMGAFFSHLSLDPVGRCIIDVCDGTACHTQGAARLVSEFEKALGIKAGQTTADGAVTLRTVGCVGACGIAPVVVLDEDAYGRVRALQVPQLAREAERRAAACDSEGQGREGDAL